MPNEVEVHFQEGFAKTPCTLSVNGAVAAEYDLTTRLMTGLAEIVHLSLAAGDELVVQAENLPPGEKYHVSGNERWLTVNIVDGRVVVRPADRGPGYL